MSIKEDGKEDVPVQQEVPQPDNQIIESGTKRRKKKLVDKRGYRYTLRVTPFVSMEHENFFFLRVILKYYIQCLHVHVQFYCIILAYKRRQLCMLEVQQESQGAAVSSHSDTA